MYKSKFKLALHWLLITLGFYIFWVFSYLILTKFATSEVSRFHHSKQSIWGQLTAADIFWYIMFVFGVALVTYVIKLCIKYAPNRRIAALLYTLLIILSVGMLVDKLIETTTFLYIIPHFIINIVFLVPIAYALFKANGKVEDDGLSN